MRLWPESTIRDADGGEILELFLVAAVAALLLIRSFLALTHYPHLGGSHLHIAHVLWGGLLMLAALMLLISYWSPGVRWLAGLLGGVGFGTFIDELGKLITEDNDYFYQPAFALIYAIFVALFVAVRVLHVHRPFSDAELAANAQLRAVLVPARAGAGREAGPWRRLVGRAARGYERLVLRPGFRTGLVAIFAGAALSHVATVAGVEVFGHHPRGDGTVGQIRALGSIVSGLFVVVGAVQLRRSRLEGYRWFQRSIVVSILAVEFFLFLETALAALGVLVIDVLLYLALGYVIRREEVRAPAAVRR